MNLSVEQQQQKARDWAASQGMISVEQQQQKLIDEPQKNNNTNNDLLFKIAALFVAFILGFCIRCALPHIEILTYFL